MYDEKARIRNDRYKKAKREKVALDVPKGTKEKYRAFAERQGMSMTAYIVMLMEREMMESGFNAEWNKKMREEQAREEKELEEVLASIRSEMKPPAMK